MSLTIDVVNNEVIIETTTGAATSDLSNLPANAVAVDGNDTAIVFVDGVLSQVQLDDIAVADGSTKANLAGGNAFTGDQTFDDGTGKIAIRSDAFGQTILTLRNEANTQNSLIIGQLSGNGGITWADGAGLEDVTLLRAGAGQVQFALGRIIPRVTSQTGNAPTWTVASCDVLVVTSITGTVNLGTNMTTGTLANGEIRRVALTGNGTHSITWPSLFEASNTYALPTALPASGVRLDTTFIYSTSGSKLRCIGVA